ncbi:TetR/AcrR family transcriptional regulator [Terribacillus sp. DMT04]|uniref:TetR/AcrR family transcriptional regulator n=1 Tax=Terribacillus sp. DMT04 TaxID=2850441 RepID=UPI001C2CBE7C|nr:TetR/AcrR family transcriptional regulator [Terribacillus sp. DMT04]QXE01360.1 TetR/AcrR family transcriptional regulator [Terribacillus sp. DMT04]
MARKKEVSAEQTQRTIIATAERLFMSHGYRAISTRRIAEECGITQPALYHHFPNKQAIYLEVVRTIMAQTEQAMTDVLQDYANSKERIQRIAYFMIMNHQGDMTQMFHDLQYEIDEEHRQTIQDWWMRSYFNPVMQTLTEGIAKGDVMSLPSAPPMELSFFVLEMMKSFLPPAKQDYEARRKFAEKKSNMLVDILFNGIRKK